ncbi:MAG: heavy metal sensor histidine kinase [Betaproteobacteria bacterium]|nr:heavy metal sensor histidine kinase [Betaproteobacteria bacterium]
MRLIRGKSITLRLTLLFAAASTVVLLALGLLIGHSVERHFEAQDVEVLNGKLDLTRHALAKVQSRTDLDALAHQLEDALVGHHGLAIAIFGPQAQTLFASGGARFPRSLLETRSSGESGRPVVWVQGERALRGIAAAVPTGSSEWPAVTVAISTDIAHHLEFMGAFRRTLWLFVAGAALLTGLLGWAAVRRGLAPLRDIRRGAAAVTASRLDYRLPVGAVPVELAELAATLNDMLARLEDSFRRLSDFSGDLAHELRTPVANLMTETQVALSRARTADEYREVLYSNAEEFEHLARMISDMLFLAKADNGLIVPHRERVDLAAQVRDLFDFYEALAQEKGVRLIVVGQAGADGDKLMLRRALGNLLSNAIRHTPAAGRVTIELAQRGDGTVSAVVENTGEPIAAEHLARLFDRFYRVDPARARASDGVGLGLAITRSIVEAHGGQIRVSSGTGTTRFELRLPRSQSTPATTG